MKNVLVIDDDKTIRELLKKYLTKKGYNVSVAKDGKDGIDLFRSACNLDVIITDVEMPVMDGNVVANLIRSSKKPDIPILAITAAHESLFQRHLFNEVLPKPFNLKRLRSILESFL